MKNLFGESIQETHKPAPTFEEEYQAYINSPAWRAKRKSKLAAVGFRCEKCKITKYSAKLEVHHLHYDTFKHERMEDLQVLCPKCHKQADTERAYNTKRKQEARLEDARLNGWASKVYGEFWYDHGDTESIREEFNDWLERKGRCTYD